MTKKQEEMYDLGIEPEPGDDPPEPAPHIDEGQLARMPIVRALPSGFNLVTLLEFMPDPALKVKADRLADEAAAVAVTGRDGVTAASAALVPLRDQLADIRSKFSLPKGLAYKLWKRLTGLEGEFCKRGDEVVDKQNKAILRETQRLDEEARVEAARKQAEADQRAKDAAAKAAKDAKKSGASPGVVKELQRQAKAATAPPVKVEGAPELVGMATTQRWKARFKGTADDAEPNPDMASLNVQQQAQVRRLMLAVTRGEVPLVVFEINWSELNDRAGSERSTLDIPEIEAFNAGGTRRR